MARITPNAIGLGLLFVLSCALLVWSPVTIGGEARADESASAGDEMVVPGNYDREAIRHGVTRAQLEAARRR